MRFSKLENLNRPLATLILQICSFISQNYGDPDQVRNCYLVGLNDLDGAQTYVQDVQAKYMNDLISIGVAGTLETVQDFLIKLGIKPLR